MTQNTKHIALLLFAAALVSVILLSSSLSNLQFHAGAPFPGSGSSVDANQPVTALVSEYTFSPSVWKGVLELLLLLLLISVPARLIPFLNAKRTFQVLLVVIAFLLLATLLPPFDGSQPAQMSAPPPAVTLTPFEHSTSPLGDLPQGVMWLASIVVVFGMGALLVKILKQQPASIQVEDQLSQEAESAIDAIKGGENLRNVIIRCYLQMARALQEDQDIERNENMTVRDFEDWLQSRGFPSVPVHQLSHLFEKVRYGRQEVDHEDEKTAVESLNQIVQFCRSQEAARR